MTLVAGPDGLPARLVKPWSAEKFHVYERYLDIFCKGMRKRWDLVYADLLAGPGLCVTPTSRSLKGSAVLAAQRTEFTALYLNDLDPAATSALQSRLGNDPRLRIDTLDCNEAATTARRELFRRASPRRTLGLAVIDPQGFQMRLESLVDLTRDLRMDLIITFMTGYVRRFLSEPGFDTHLDGFLGTADWRRLRPGLETGGRSPSYRALLDLYKEQLHRIGYAYVDDHVQVLNRRERNVYHLVFASKSPRGTDFYEKISRKRATGQLRLMESSAPYDAPQ